MTCALKNCKDQNGPIFLIFFSKSVLKLLLAIKPFCGFSPRTTINKILRWTLATYEPWISLQKGKNDFDVVQCI